MYNDGQNGGETNVPRDGVFDGGQLGDQSVAENGTASAPARNYEENNYYNNQPIYSNNQLNNSQGDYEQDGSNHGFANADYPIAQTPVEPLNQQQPHTPQLVVDQEAIAQGVPSTNESDSIIWTAVDHNSDTHGTKWYTAVFSAYSAVIIASLVVFFIKWTDLFTMVSVIGLATVIVVSLLVANKMPARSYRYAISDEGISVNGKTYKFSDFRAFGVRQHHTDWQLVLLPVKRFGMEFVAYIEETDGEKIVDFLAAYLPMEEVPESSIENIINKFTI